jgi:glycosyltransferase involved in cell wall biosynthesis
MRVAIIAPPWIPVPPPAYGGTETVLDFLARGLQSAGHDVMLFGTGDCTCPVPKAWVLPEAAGTVNMGSPIEIRHVIHGYEMAMEWGADVIHDHTMVGPVYAERFEVPVVTTNHGPFDGDLEDFYRVIAPSVSIVAISAHQAKSAGATEIGAIIHHGVDVASFPDGQGDGGYALFLGRMCETKGVDTAIRIAREAGVPLKIAAKLREPAEYVYYESEVKPLLGDDVEFIGEVGGQAKLDLLAHATCLLNPIAWPEPFGMVMIEALACGTPVLATPCGSVPEIVDDGVTGFIRSSPADLTEMLGQVGTIDRGHCRSIAALRFSSERMVDDHVALYEQVVAAKGRVPSRAA